MDECPRRAADPYQPPASPLCVETCRADTVPCVRPAAFHPLNDGPREPAYRVVQDGPNAYETVDSARGWSKSLIVRADVRVLTAGFVAATVATGWGIAGDDRRIRGARAFV
jgi:hypothetical protein